MEPEDSIPMVYTGVYSVKTKYTDVTLRLSDRELYYTKYTLARKSEYFNKKFTSDMADSNDNVIDMTEYTVSTLVPVLTALDNGYSYDIFTEIDGDECINVFMFLSYYSFTELIQKLIHDEKACKSVPDMSFISGLYIHELVDGSYATEFSDLIEKLVSRYVSDLTKQVRFVGVEKIVNVMKHIDELVDVHEEIYKLIVKNLLKQLAKPTELAKKTVKPKQ